jgi:hypothetical protein
MSAIIEFRSQPVVKEWVWDEWVIIETDEKVGSDEPVSKWG